MKENKYQAHVIQRLKTEFPGVFVLKNDPNYIQGMPDITVLFENKWATLEVKRCQDASHQPNQDYYVKQMNQIGFSRFIFPENEDDVFVELSEHFYK